VPENVQLSFFVKFSFYTVKLNSLAYGMYGTLEGRYGMIVATPRLLAILTMLVALRAF